MRVKKRHLTDVIYLLLFDLNQILKMEKKIYPTAAQKTRLIALLEADEELRQGKFSSTFTKKVAEARWRKIAEDVNSIPGACKEWKDWRKTWQDMKSKSKKMLSAIRRQQNMTGGGPPPPTLSDEACSILNTISEAALSGHSDSSESIVIFSDVLRKPKEQNKPTATITSSSIIEKGTDDDNISTMIDINASSVIQLEESPANVKELENDEKQIPKNTEGKNKKIKIVAQRRLQKSLDAAEALQKALEEKNNYKKIFYENYIIEMRKQTQVLSDIANNLKFHQK